MRVQSLNTRAGAEWKMRQSGSEAWHPAIVPGGVHTDLMADHFIPDPFVADHEKEVAWVAESDWEYHGHFELDPLLLRDDQVFLVCDGLDTLAAISLNGQPLDKTNNMFRQYRWEVKSLLQEGKNNLAISFASPVSYAAACQKNRRLISAPQAIPGGPYLRKSASQFGWDWGPRLPPIGIWRSLRLESYSTARLEDIHLRQVHTGSGVMLQASIVVSKWGEGALEAELNLTSPDGLFSSTRMPLQENQGVLTLDVENPQLWWPNGYGQQPLYDVEVRLLMGNTELDQRDYQLGLRTIELSRQPDQWGESFNFIVNGVPIFARGSNWIPADSFPTRITQSQLEHLLGSAAAANQNMLRVWGGGYYEDEYFYDLCDRLGLLVWQDFMFACSTLPLGDPEYTENIHQEVIQNVRRLRHRTCIALWCGNNEMEQAWAEWGWSLNIFWRDLRKTYGTFFHDILANWVAAEDLDRPYWPSSPSSNQPFLKPNSQERGDAHYWEVWHRQAPFSAFRRQFPRFMSEFGFQSLPTYRTVETFASPEQLHLESPVMKHHQRSGNGNRLILNQMAQLFRKPKDFGAMVYTSMVLQAEGIRQGVEHWRRHRDRVGGTLYWQLNDCWPAVSWSSLDYYGRWKALHYLARRFYAPVLLSVEDFPQQMDLHITNDHPVEWKGRIRWSLEWLDGSPLLQGEEAVKAEPGVSRKVTSVRLSGKLTREQRSHAILVCELLEEEQRLALFSVPCAPDKDLAPVDPNISWETAPFEGGLAVCLKSHSLARYVELGLGDVDVIFSDNYFDLPAGRDVTITIPLPAGWTLEQASEALKVKSLYNSYQL